MRESKRKIPGALFLALVFLSGPSAAFLAAKINGARFGFYLWPLMACVDLFVFATAGFFASEGKAEALYGACSIAGVVCLIAQLAILF